MVQTAYVSSQIIWLFYGLALLCCNEFLIVVQFGYVLQLQIENSESKDGKKYIQIQKKCKLKNTKCEI